MKSNILIELQRKAEDLIREAKRQDREEKLRRKKVLTKRETTELAKYRMESIVQRVEMIDHQFNEIKKDLKALPNSHKSRKFKEELKKQFSELRVN